MKHKWMMGLCVVCAAALAMPAAAAQGPAQFAQSENCLSGLWEALQGSGFVTAEDGRVRYRSGWGDWQRFEPGFGTVEGQLYHVEADGVTFTRLPLGLSVVDGSVCYSSDGLSIQTFAPGFVTLDGRLYRVAADGYSFECRTAGVYLLGDEVYCVPADGAEFLTNGVYNGLQFGPDGRYTSGNAQLDGLVRQALDACCDPSMTQEEKLRAAYLYLRDNGRYLARSHYPRGSVDWAMAEGQFFLENHRGNCYGFAGAFLYMARQLGYQAYPVSGGVGYDNRDHAWVMIPWWNGTTYMFDVELEYAYRYRYANRRLLNLYQMTPATAPFVYTFPQ